MSDAEELNAIQRRRRSLYQATLGLEAGISSPTGNLRLWRDRVHAAAVELHTAIAAHVSESEQPGEFLDSITTQAPHLISAAKKLASEHQDLLIAASNLITRIDTLDPSTEPSAAEPVRHAALQLMGSLVRHRQRGTDLVYLAYGEDLGTSG